MINLQECYMDENDQGKKGSMPVPHARDVLLDYTRFLRWNKLANGVLSQSAIFNVIDFHPRNHISFASTHGAPEYSTIDIQCNLNRTHGDPFAAKYGIYPPEGFAAQNPYATCCNTTVADTLCECATKQCFNMTQELYPDHCINTEDGGVPESFPL